MLDELQQQTFDPEFAQILNAAELLLLRNLFSNNANITCTSPIILDGEQTGVTAGLLICYLRNDPVLANLPARASLACRILIENLPSGILDLARICEEFHKEGIYKESKINWKSQGF